ncbi:MAG TPA: hypothetical protein O0X39_01345 [Methanocorpusculum sp.]|nr:hypothetical protein [Methanocorpusculum sp.]
MKQYMNVSYGGCEPASIEYATDATIVNTGIYSRTEQDEHGEEQTIWYVTTQYIYSPQEYEQIYAAALKQAQADTDDLLIDLDSRLSELEGA